ncbi:biotin--[acetyl-CoA-carboxylase] ligase [Schleiferia thermophila]|jgi:BirA family biotin operon repressor/biotin-[acetyl-CoA-carboxylase] ligase|uniref:biotin--[biotin carboxyl-carrier protein] ligase n=1 Tax=Schleiferia thermophila TaxID=884107 RepID=A0A369A5J6_9FLAO|nr:biotin--[acetyl-CoA-carboxylase] ligase [Schleiferia thermophila]KFD39227.1 hypothetical protein AT05_06255 [Schleiferia thermophila str. Yellowstone]RCX03347.1 BirA family biotin operon repressor/biotin-[acetyl-CoA-carboxylase] ligase [Schleiferia thermophila]GCD80476.1 biotin--[acetyl-CoA-carboxylase] ligase [Schleiferia thermophila]
MFSIISFPELPSTNDYLKHLVETHKAPDNLLIFTLHQSNGRGQFQRKWFSEPGLDLAFSFYQRKNLDSTPFQPALFVMSVCLALVKTFDTFGIKCKVKWPNDLLYGSKKIAGVLLESFVQDKKIHIITGIGINMNSHRNNDAELNSISMLDIRKVLTGPEDVLKAFEQNYESVMNLFDDDLVLETYNKALYKLNEKVSLKMNSEGEWITGILKGVDARGRLCLKTGSGIIHVHHGQGSLVRD